MPDLKLYYFQGAGRAECTRLALHYGGIPFEDIRFDANDWVSKFKAMSPTGQAPVLEVDGKRYVESIAIFAYACKLAKLVPECPLKEAACYQFILHTDLLIVAFRDLIYAKPEQVETMKQKLFEGLGPMMKRFEEFAAIKGFDGPIDMADVYALSLIESVKQNAPRFNMPSPFEHATNMNKLADRARSNDKIKAYLASKS